MTGVGEDLKDWAYRKRITIVRRGFLVVIFVLLNSMLYGMFNFGRHPQLRYVLLPNASCRYIDNAPTYCYYYSLQNWLTGGFSSFYQEIFIPMLILGILIIALGRWWCSWACPFGLVQEIYMSIRDMMKIPYYQLNYKWVAFLDQTKYAVLFFTLLVAVAIGIPYLGLPMNIGLDIPIYGEQPVNFALPFCQICPAKGFFTLLQMLLFLIPMNKIPPIALLMLGIFTAGSFTIRMFWCRVCPMGAVMGLCNRRSLFWLRKDPSRCTKCRICLRVCPQDYSSVYEEMERENITGPECTLCGRCVESCPEKEALSLNLLNLTLIRSKPKR